MPSRKRAHTEVEADNTPQPPSLLSRIRNDWKFASVVQYIHIFGSAIKIADDVDVDMIEEELLKQPHSEKLTEIGLAMLRMISSHRGLTPEIFDEYTRRQYVAKAPQRNPFGEDDEPAHFAEMDVFGKLSVLHQLSVWTFWNQDRMRERMPEKDSQQTEWRIPPAGWDAQDREYYVLDDDRLYRTTHKPLPPPKSKSKPKPKPKPKKKAAPPRPRGSRSSKRQRMLNGVESDADADELDEEEEDDQAEDSTNADNWDEPDDNGLGGDKWELIAITLEEYQAFLSTINKTRDPNEKALRRYLEENSLPALERAAASRARKAAARERELAALEKMAGAKRSSRISAKNQAQKEAEDREIAERRKKEELIAAQKEMIRQARMEEERDNRMLTREQRLKDRETRRILHEEEIQKLQADEAAAEAQEGRMSERALKAKLQKKQEALDELKQEEEEDWYFDCAKCGVHGKNIDDGSHSMACEKCGVWQHSKCHGITEQQAESDDFHFICASCSKPRPIKINLSTAPTTDAGANVQSNGVNDKSAAAEEVKPAPRKPEISTQPSGSSPTPHPNQLPPIHHQPQLQQQQHLPPIHAAHPVTQPLHHLVPPQPHSQHGHTLPPVNIPPSHSQVNGYPHAPPPDVHRAQQPTHPSHSQPAASPNGVYAHHQQHRQPSAPQWQASPPVHTPQQNPYLHNLARPRPPQSSPTHGQASPSLHGSSPAPSLAATQGTNIRFSPTTNHSNLAGSHAYTPSSNRPSAAAYSPTKKASSSPQAAAAGPLSSPPQAKYPAPAPQSSVLPSATSGVSPVKQAHPGSSPPPSVVMPSVSPPQFSTRSPFDQPPHLRQGLGISSPSNGETRLPPASSLSSLPPVPALSPTQAKPNLTVPVKKDR